MQYTQAQIDRANAVSLEDFLRTQGETLIKSGREYRWKEHDSLNVTFLPRMRMVLLPVNRFLMGIIRSIRLQARKAKPLSRTLRYSFPLMERLTAIS